MVDWNLCDILPEGERIHVLDIGAAFVEEPPYQSLLKAGRATITAFEPDDQARARLLEIYGDEHRILPNFVGTGEARNFHQLNWPITSSLLPPNTPLLLKFQMLEEVMQPVGQRLVETVRLDDLHEIQDVDFIKIDVQGGELDVLSHAGRLLPDVLLIQVEVEFVTLYRNQPLFADVDRFLRSAGFQFHTFHSLSGRAFKPMIPEAGACSPFRQLLWSDALYVADWMKLDRLDDRRLRRYAVLAHDVLRSYDLAHLILSELDRRTGELMADLYLIMHNQA